MTHAFFKALLFLGAGSVIHAMGDEQDMTRMGGLFRPMRVTAVTSAIAVLAISGIPPISGYWSKDDILAATFERGGWYYVLWAVGLLTAGLTAFYMTRWFILTFLGEPRWAEGAHPHESPRVMTLPLVGLAVLTVVAGFVNTPFYPGLELFLEPSFEGVAQAHPPGSPLVWIIAAVSTFAGLAGIGIAAVIYLGPAGFRRGSESGSPAYCTCGRPVSNTLKPGNNSTFPFPHPAPFLRDPTLPVDHEGAALDAAHLAAVHVLHLHHAEDPARLLVRVREQLEREAHLAS